MRRLLIIAIGLSCLLLPVARAHAGNQGSVGIDPTKLRVSPDAFAPATVTTATVENNADASANYVGTHHGVSYSALGRITGYYERADYNDVVYLRYQASTFVTNEAAAAALQNSVGYASIQFGGPDTCSGDDDAVGSGDTVVDIDNQFVGDPFGLDDQDPNCIMSDYTGGGSSSGAVGAGGGVNAFSPITPLDCSGDVGVPCQQLGFGFSTPDDRMWYDVYTVLQVNTCLAEVDLTMRPEDVGAVDDSAVMRGAATALTAACPNTPAPTPTIHPAIQVPPGSSPYFATPPPFLHP